MNSNISHILSQDGLKLTSTAVINNHQSTVTIEWDAKQTVSSRNYLDAVAAAEKHFKTVSTDAHHNVSLNRVRRFQVGGFVVSYGVFHGNKWDKGRITVGRKSWVTNTTLTTVRWSTLHADRDYAPNGLTFGAGGVNKAAMLSIQRNRR